MELHAHEKIGNKRMWKCIEWMVESGERNGFDRYQKMVMEMMGLMGFGKNRKVDERGKFMGLGVQWT